MKSDLNAEETAKLVTPLVKSAASPGCRLRVWEDDNYLDRDTYFHGPAEYPKLDDVPGDWGDEIDSLCAGPNTWAEVFEDDNFTDTKLYVYPNQCFPVLDDHDIGDNIDSIKIYNSRPAHFP